MKLDDIDKKILESLQDDARISLRKIARELGVSVVTISNRVKKLQENGTIDGFHTRLNLNKLGKNLVVTIQLTVDPTKFEEIIPKLIEYPQLVQVTATSGEYNLLVNGVFDNQAQLVEFLNSQLFKMNGVLKTNIITWLKEYKNSWKISL